MFSDFFHVDEMIVYVRLRPLKPIFCRQEQQGCIASHLRAGFAGMMHFRGKNRQSALIFPF